MSGTYFDFLKIIISLKLSGITLIYQMFAVICVTYCIHN